MHSQLSILLLLATITSVANSQTFPGEASLPGCGETCLDAVVNDASTFGCSDGSAGCLCAAPNFQNGVRDCASAACAADLYPSVTNYLASVCATAAAAAGAATACDLGPCGTVPVVHTCAYHQQLRGRLGANLHDEPDSAPKYSLQPNGLHKLDDPFWLPPEHYIGNSLDLGSEFKLSGGSRWRTCIGVYLSIVSGHWRYGDYFPDFAVFFHRIGYLFPNFYTSPLSAIVACVITRKHKSRQQQPGLRSYEISEPMPGAGRVYANENNSQGFEPVSELEMKSRRYEDMMPRHVPRNMV
ncbi:cfem domain protein [Ophiostoma piceae UAMH 11346]|uniref:Cfem domain protein n=1 Tax=Ophiostoma piceae (strain UAMH 11346) TaxID=1262450 RepID=S3D104_OPHP1|nr:cfem domain protein [Ophiostoma piceae UAMH 11346]